MAPSTAAAAPASTTPADPDATQSCGPAGLTLETWGWLPPDTTAVGRFALDDPDLSAALDAAGAYVGTPGHGLPIDIAFAMKQWSWQILGLRSLLRIAGFAPAEIAYLRFSDGVTAWVFPLQCDLDATIARMHDAWSVDVRRTLSGAIGSPPPGSSFPFDVVFLEGERLALTPRNQGPRLAEHVSRTSSPPAPALGRRPDSLAVLLEQLSPAPIRGVVRVHGLVDSGAVVAAGEASSLVRAFRGSSQSFGDVTRALPESTAAPDPALTNSSTQRLDSPR